VTGGPALRPRRADLRRAPGLAVITVA